MAAAASPRTFNGFVDACHHESLHDKKGKEFCSKWTRSTWKILLAMIDKSINDEFETGEANSLRHCGMKFITTVRLFVKNDREPESRRKRITKIRQRSRGDRLYSSNRFVLHDSLFTRDHRFPILPLSPIMPPILSIFQS